MNYIGVDCHISTLDFAVVNERGTTTKRVKVNTGVKEFIGFIKTCPSPEKFTLKRVNWQGGCLKNTGLDRAQNRPGD